METYALEVSETENGDGITAEVYDEDGTIVESQWAGYEQHGLTKAQEGETPDPRRRETTVDVTSLSLQFERDGGGFVFRLLGDGSELLSERVDDTDWNLVGADE